MRDEYDFKKGKRGYYNDKFEKGKITIRLDDDVISYFKKMAAKKGISYQTLINLYLRYCKDKKEEIKISWRKSA